MKNIESAKEWMKDFFERYYSKLYNENEIFVKLPGVPEEMLADGADSNKEWNVWKLIPSTVTEEEISKLEEEYKLKFPIIIKAFLSTYHHLFEEPIGRNSISQKFFGMDNAYNPQLAANNFLPFAWDSEHYFIRCIDLTNMPDEDKCPVLEIDHEYLFDLQYDAEEKGEVVPRESLMQYMRPIADNFIEFLENTYEEFGNYEDDEEVE